MSFKNFKLLTLRYVKYIPHSV